MKRRFISLAAAAGLVLSVALAGTASAGNGCLSGYHIVDATGSRHQYDGNHDGKVCRQGNTSNYTDNTY